MNYERIGVVVIGRNEGGRLDRCLATLGGLPHVVYVDSASTDDSVAIAAHHGVSVISLTTTSALTAARGRNAGARNLIEQKTIEFIQFIDGDCELAPEWLPSAQEFLDKHPRVAVVCGRRYERAPEFSLYNKLCDREWNTPIGQAESSGGDALVRRSAFLEVNGFTDDQTAHEEPEFCARLRKAGWQIWRIDAAMTKHDAQMERWEQFYRRSRRAGFGLSQLFFRPGSITDTAGRNILRRTFIWAILLPMLAIIGLFVSWKVSATLGLLYILQWLRMTWYTSKDPRFNLTESMKVSALGILGKFAEAHGAIEFIIGRLSGNKAKIISHK